jgi:serine/threonine-protein kinase
VSNLVQFDVSRTGTLVYRPGGLVPMTIQWLDASGKKESLGPKALDGYSARLSPDGKRVALVVGEGAGARVSVYDPQREAMTLLTPDGRRRSSPVWTPDGRYVLFDTVGSGIFWTRADGASQPQALIQSKNIQIPWSFSPDGSRLAYIEILRSPQLWTVPVEERGGQLTAGMPERFLQTQFADWSPVFSPDGRWLAYNSNESGADEVYVRAFTAPATGQGAKVQISNRGGINPVWSRSGRELLYLSGDQIMTSSYTVSGESFVAEKPRVWAANLGRPVTFDLAPDGKRAIVLAPAETPDNLRNDHLVVFLQNFVDELRRRVPVDK